jgi:hypothetical protein
MVVVPMIVVMVMVVIMIVQDDALRDVEPCLGLCDPAAKPHQAKLISA